MREENMAITRLAIPRLAAWLAAFLFGAVASVPSVAQTKITVGYVQTADSMPIRIAKERGFFEKRKLDVTLTPIALASNIPSAIMSNSVQIGMGTVPMLLQTNEAGLGLIAVGGMSRVTKQSNIVSLVGRTGVKIDNPGDLRGKKIGVPGFNSMMHVMLQKWLLDKGVQPSQVSMVEAVFPQMNDLLKGGTLDAVVVLEPFRTRIIGGNVGFKISDYITDVQDNVMAAMWMTKGDWANANGTALRAFREGYLEGIDWALKNQKEVKEMEAKILGAATAIVPAYDYDIRAADLELYARIGRELGMLKQPVDVNKLLWK
jgi:NitT/TauT family transport system substrate-binding protein